MEWQPISTAPRDGTYIIVGVDQASAWLVSCARFEDWDNTEPDGEIGWWSYRTSISQEMLEGIFEPTHWIELPEPKLHSN